MAAKQKLIEQKVREILEQEAVKHVTHVGFAIVAIYKDGTTIAKTAARPGFEGALQSAIEHLFFQHQLASY